MEKCVTYMEERVIFVSIAIVNFHIDRHCIDIENIVVNQSIFSDETNEILKKSNDTEIILLKKSVEDMIRKHKDEIIYNSSSSYQNINHGNINNHNINDVKIQILNNYKDTDYDHLTHQDYLKCFNENNHCVKALIEKIHFDSKNPQNMNIYISGIKGNYIMVYRDNRWQLKDRKYYIDDLYEMNEIVLEKWYDNYKVKYPDIIKSFERYLHAKDDDDYINKIKKEIIMMLYNNRSIVRCKKNKLLTNG